MKKMLLLFGFATIIASAFAETSTRNKALSSELLSSWIDLHCRILRNAKGIAHVAYSRHFVYTSIATYESVVGSDATYRSLGGQLTGLEKLPRVSSVKPYWQASLNAAYAEMVRYFYAAFPACISAADSMEKLQRKIFLANGINQESLDQSTDYGRAIATSVIEWAKADGSTSTKEFVPVKAEGVWFPESKPAEPFWEESRSMIKNLFSIYELKTRFIRKRLARIFIKWPMRCIKHRFI